MIEQALFTSLRGERLDGYQLAATSPGLDDGDARELARWCPSHDALLDPSDAGRSLNFHQLGSGRYCLSSTVAAGEEYSGRGGRRIATRLLVLEQNVLARFANNPFRLYEAALAVGALDVPAEGTTELDSLKLVGGAVPFDALLVSSVCRELGPGRLARLVDAVLSRPIALAVTGPVSLERRMTALFCLLPVEQRCGISFCTGLKYSAGRPFHIQPLPSGAAEQRQFARQSGAAPIDLVDDPSDEPLESEWARLVEPALHERRYRWLAQQVASYDVGLPVGPS